MAIAGSTKTILEIVGLCQLPLQLASEQLKILFPGPRSHLQELGDFATASTCLQKKRGTEKANKDRDSAETQEREGGRQGGNHPGFTCLGNLQIALLRTT